MAKIITFNDEQRNEIRDAFEKALANYKATNGTFSFSKSLGIINRKATIKFSELAWLKMWSLIREHNQEVGWYGLTRRSETTKDEYEIYDILVYPQIRTAASIDQDQDECNKWAIELCKRDREAYRNMHMHGHSHVNMGVSPSTTDEAFYKEIIGQKCDTFWIFMIWNKRGEKTIRIYDFAENVLFETADCTVKIANDHLGIEDFLAEAQTVIRDYSHTAKTNISTTPAVNVVPSVTTAISNVSQQTDNKDTTPIPISKKKTGKRKGKRSKTTTQYSKWSGYGGYGSYNLYDELDNDW